MDKLTLQLFKKLEQRIRDVDIRQGGPRGPKGRKGDNGSVGPQGTTGSAGRDGTTGKDGPKGPTGPSGHAGKHGKNGQLGPQGPTGLAGANGLHGDDGSNGISVTDANIGFDGNLTLHLSDGGEIDAGQVVTDEAIAQIVYTSSGGLPDYWKDLVNGVIEDLNNHLGDFNNPHQVTHAQLPDVGPDDHHPQLHDLESHTDVSLVGITNGQGLWWNGTDWINRASQTETWPTGLSNGGELNIGPVDPFGPELVNWNSVSDPEVVINVDVLEYTLAPANAYAATAPAGVVNGKSYEYSYEIYDVVSGGATSLRIGGTQSATNNGAGTYTGVVVAGASDYIRLQTRLVSDHTFKARNISVKEVLVAEDGIEVIAGVGVVIDGYTDPASPPVVLALQWPQINEPITAAPAVAGSIVWFTIFDTGVAGTPINNVPTNVGGLRQYAQSPNPTLQRQEIPLGFAVHNGVVWQEVSNPKVINQTAETLREYITNVQQLTTIIEGGTVSEQPLFTLDQEAGTVWENNRNWHVDKSDPNREALPAVSPMVFEYVNRDFTVAGAPTSTIDPDIWDNAGVVEPVGGPANNTTIQRVYLDPANHYWILLGQEIYPNFLTAQANLPANTAVVPFLLQNSILLGYIIAERAKTDWDVDEAVFVSAGASGGSGGGGTPITDHNNLNGIFPDDHHPAMQAIGDYVQGVTYSKGDELFNGSDLSEARIDGVTSSPFVAPQGTPAFLYDGVGMANIAQLAKQIIFGNRYTSITEAFYITGYRVNVVAGNAYAVYSVRDPLGVPIITLHSNFTANTTGWVDIAVPTSAIPAGSLFDVVVIAQAPDPTPVEVIASYNYQTPQNPTVPLAGEIQHSRGDPAEMRISYTDNGAVDRTVLIQSLTIGDTITDGILNWSVQANGDQGTWAAIIVAPANPSTVGIKDFTFATYAPTPISVPSDPAYWPTSTTPQVEGLIGVDVPYDQVLMDTNAYGVDLLIQPAYVPDPAEWMLKILAATGGSGGGGDSPWTEVQDGISYAAGNVGIGTATPENDLHVASTGSAANIVLQRTDAPADQGRWDTLAGNGSWSVRAVADALVGQVAYQIDRVGVNATTHRWSVAGVEYARIDSSGKFLVGLTASFVNTDGVLQVYNSNVGNAAAAATFSVATVSVNTNNVMVNFRSSTNVGQGSITGNGAGAAAFGATSDARLKENIVPLAGELANIMALNPVSFDYIEGGSNIGFIAQEMHDVYPDSVGVPDAPEDMLTISGWSKTEARLVKAIQELTARLEVLEHTN